MKFATFTSAAALVLSGVVLASGAQARDQIRIVGSSTVYPFTTTVAEQLGRTGIKTPIVESTGTGGGMKLFCAGVGVDHPDASNASRRIKKSEFEDCQKNGVTDIVELKIGFDGIVIANAKSGPELHLTKKQLFLALAREIPGRDGKLIANPNKIWSDIDPSLPNEKIEVLGPPPTSGTRDAFLELVMEAGAAEIAELKELKQADAKAFDAVWKSIREDGAYIDAGENDNLIVQKLDANPKAVGIFGYSFLEANTSRIKGAAVDGVQPTFENIASGDYTVSRPLFVYVKKQHLDFVPGLEKFVAEFVSERAIGEEGYLSDKGLIPLPADDRAKVADAARSMKALGAEAF